MQVTAIWIPLPTARSGAPAPLGLSTKGGAQPLFDSRETAPLKRVVAWLRSRRAAPDPQAKGAAFAPSPLSTPAPPPTLGWRVIVSPPRGRPPEAMGEREAYLRPGTPVVHLLCGSGHASADSRGRLAPTSGRAPTRNRTFAARRKWQRVGWVLRARMRPCGIQRHANGVAWAVG